MSYNGEPFGGDYHIASAIMHLATSLSPSGIDMHIQLTKRVSDLGIMQAPRIHRRLQVRKRLAAAVEDKCPTKYDSLRRAKAINSFIPRTSSVFQTTQSGGKGHYHET